jgi:hypothetical protein
MSTVKITDLNVIEKNPYIQNDVLKFKITLDNTVIGYKKSKPYLVFTLNNSIYKCALLITNSDQTNELEFGYTILQGDLDLLGIKLVSNSNGEIIYYGDPSSKITGTSGDPLDTKFSNTLPVIKIDTRGEPINYQTANYKIPIKINSNPLNINATNQTIDSYFSLAEASKPIEDAKVFAKKATIDKIEFSPDRKAGSITPGDTDYYKQGDTISGKIEFTSVWDGYPDAFANGILSTLSTTPKVKLVIQSRTSPIELNCSLSTDKNSLSFNYTVQNNDNDSDGITILTKKSANNDNELDIISSSNISDIYGNPVSFIVPNTIDLLNMPKYKIKTSITKIKVVDLSNTPDGILGQDASTLNALYKPHYYTINNKIIIDYYFDSNIYFKSPQTATDMILPIQQDNPLDEIKINNPIITRSPPESETWSWTYNSNTINLNTVGSKLRFEYIIGGNQQSLTKLGLSNLKDSVLIDEAGNYVNTQYLSTDALLAGKHNQFSYFNQTAHNSLLSMYRIDTIPISIEKINVSISNFVPGAEKQTETVFNKYTVGTSITFNLTFSREVYIKTVSDDEAKLRIKIGYETRSATIKGYENGNNKKILSFVYSIIQNDVGDNISVLIGNNNLTYLDGVQIGDDNVYTGGGITSVGSINVSKKTPNDINYIPYDNTKPQTEISQNHGIIPYKIDTLKPRIKSVTITNDSTTLKLMGINNIIYIRINFDFELPAKDEDPPNLLADKRIKILKNTEDPKLKLNLVHNQIHRYALFNKELSKPSDNFLIFSYTIQPGDDTDSFNYNSANAFERNPDNFIISDQVGNIQTDYELPPENGFNDIKSLGITINTSIPDKNLLDEALPALISGSVTLNLDFTKLDDAKKNLIVTDLAKELDGIDESLITNVTYERGSTVVNFKVNVAKLNPNKITAIKAVNLKNKTIAGSTVTSSSVSETDTVKPFTDINLAAVPNLQNYTYWIIPSDIAIVQNMQFQQKNNPETWTRSVQGTSIIKSPQRAGIYKLYIINQFGNISQSANTTITVLPPRNQNYVFNVDSIKRYLRFTELSILSSGDESNSIWLAQAGKTTSNQFTLPSINMSKAENGTSTKIKTPEEEGNYYLYIIDQYHNVSSPSSLYVIVDNTPPNQPIVSWPTQPMKNNIVYTKNTTFQITNSIQTHDIITKLQVKIGDQPSIPQDQINFFTITENKEYEIGDIKVFFLDEAGNESIPATNPQKIRIDTIPPPPLLIDTDETGTLNNDILTTDSTRLFFKNISLEDQNKLNYEGITSFEYSTDSGTSWTSNQLIVNGTNYIFLPHGRFVKEQVHIKLVDIVGHITVTKNSFIIINDIPKIISIAYSGGINKPPVQIVKDNLIFPMEINGTVTQDVNILFTTHYFKDKLVVAAAEVPDGGSISLTGIGNSYTKNVVDESGSINIPKGFINNIPLDNIHPLVVTGVNSSNIPAGGQKYRQSITIHITRKQQIGSDTIATGNIDNKVYQRFKNVVSIEVKNVILPLETLLFTPDTLSINTLSYPYILLHIREFNDINKSTDSHIDNAFCKLTLRDTGTDKINNNRIMCNFVPISKEKKIFSPKPLDSLSKMSIYFTTPQGNLLSNANDISNVIKISLSEDNKIINLSISNIDTITNNPQYFSNKLIKLGDLYFFKNIHIINLNISNDPILNNINNSFIQFLQREEGHRVHSMANPANVISEYNNTLSFENSLFSLFNSSNGTFTINNETYTTEKINEYHNYLSSCIVIGFIANASLQHNITLDITTKEYYMDYSKNKRII